jgi:hypothetical protein
MGMVIDGLDLVNFRQQLLVCDLSMPAPWIQQEQRAECDQKILEHRATPLYCLEKRWAKD